MTYGSYRKPIQQLTDRCALFSALSDRHLLELEAEDSIRTYALEDGESLVLKGGAGKDAVFILEGAMAYASVENGSGTLDVRSTSCRPLTLRATGAVTFMARGRATLCRADHDHLDYMLGWKTLVDQLEPETNDVHARLVSLRHPAVFMRLPFENVEEAFRRMRSIEVTAGQEVVKQGDPGDRFYAIETGRAEVWQQGLYDDEQQKVAEIGTGSHFGDEALVTGGTRNATVRMTEGGRLLVLSKSDFDALIHKPLVQEVEASIAKALIDSGYQVIDVRYEEEFADEHLPKVTLIPLPELRHRMSELDGDAKYLTYCFSGKRSAVASMIMRQCGFDAVCLAGGIRDWPYDLEAA